MKNLTNFCREIRLHFNLDHYVTDIEKEQANELDYWRKKSLAQKMEWLLRLALKTLARLQKTHHFRREHYWQTLMSEHLAALTAPAMTIEQTMIAVRQANDLIAVAHEIIDTRTGLLETVKNQILLSPQQEQQYEAIRQTAQTHNNRLNLVQQQVLKLQSDYHNSRQPVGLDALIVQEQPDQSLPKKLFSYFVEKQQLQVIEASLEGSIRTDADSRELYQDLAKKLATGKPSVEKLSEDIKEARSYLQQKTVKILDHAKTLREQIRTDIRQTIEHRTQTILAHAQQCEQLVSSLDQIIVLLQKPLCAYDRPGRKIMTEIHRHQAPGASIHRAGLFSYLPSAGRALANLALTASQTQLALGYKKLTPEQLTQLQQQIEQIGAAQAVFTSSLTSQWSTLFSTTRRLQRQQELLLNTRVQQELAKLPHLIYKLKDVQNMGSSEQVQRRQALVEKLAEIEPPALPALA